MKEEGRSVGNIPPDQKNQVLTFQKQMHRPVIKKEQQQQQNELNKISRFLNSLELGWLLMAILCK